MTLPSFDLSKKIAIVTGGSRGIGEHAARALAAHGAHVVVASRKGEDCEAVAAAIRSAGHRAEAVACHMGDLDAVEQLFAHVERSHGRLDILVNNAATNPYFGPIADTDLRAFDKTVEVNLRGPFFATARAVKLMAKTGGGSVINIASINAVLPGHFQGIYSITKAALISMTKAFAKECASDGVRVNAILPGLTDTKLASAIVQNEGVVQKVLEHVPLGRVAQPDEISGAILYLASPASSYTTGAEFAVDGGYLTV